MEVLLTVGLMYGLTFSVKDAKLLTWPRNWVVTRSEFAADLLNCAFCTGFHSGWLSFAILSLGGMAGLLPFWVGLVVYAFVGAAVSYTIDTVMVALESD